MPYAIRKHQTQYCVEKKDGSKTFGCHPTLTQAKRQLAAIYANTNEPTAKAAPLHLTITKRN